MAKIVIKAAYLALGGTDYSAQCDSIELTVEADDVAVTNFGSGGWKESLQGIKNATLNFQLKQDADLSGFDAAVWAVLIHATTNTLAFEVRQSSGSVSTANPKFTGSTLVIQSGVSLKLGEAFGRSFAWPVTGAVTRATS